MSYTTSLVLSGAGTGYSPTTWSRSVLWPGDQPRVNAATPAPVRQPTRPLASGQALFQVEVARTRQSYSLAAQGGSGNVDGKGIKVDMAVSPRLTRASQQQVCELLSTIFTRADLSAIPPPQERGSDGSPRQHHTYHIQARSTWWGRFTGAEVRVKSTAALVVF